MGRAKGFEARQIQLPKRFMAYLLEHHKRPEGGGLIWLADKDGNPHSEKFTRKPIEADLREANLSGVNLSGADLRMADLRMANLCRAILRETDLSEANLHMANFLHADLSGAIR